ncbi:hypothetical protein [Halobacterium sp. R2-5]|uniref:hypothetical protein n=1 Tax=Halobacterium sp. R2-5 TaxID=2715751 RepID=UPI001AAE88E0|nr:hypothetical protein [Halobacterium sp. R2-5]
MQRDSQGTPTSRRSFLGTIGLTLAGLGVASGSGAAADESFALEQGDRCVPVTPLSGDAPVEELYDWNTDDSDFSAAGLTELQRPDTSILFLYDGPNGLSLVLVHDEYGDETDGGSATFEITGLPVDGEWVVRDDYYDGESNFDRWVTGDGTAAIDWTWGASRTDGGVYRGLADQPDLELRIEPAFNDAAALDGEHYDGEITAWEVLSGSLSDPDRTSLALDEPVVLRRGACSTDGTGGDGSDDQTDDGDEQADEDHDEEQSDDEEREEEEENEEETEDEEEQEDEEKDDDRDSDEDEGDDEDEEEEDGDDEEDEEDEDDDDEEEEDEEEEDEEEEEDDDHPGKGKGKGNNGDHPGKGKGHEKGNGKGHRRHGDD